MEITNMIPGSLKLQKCERIKGSAVVTRQNTRVNPHARVPEYQIVYTDRETYIAYGPGFPTGFEHWSITKVRKAVDLMGYEYAT